MSYVPYVVRTFVRHPTGCRGKVSFSHQLCMIEEVFRRDDSSACIISLSDEAVICGNVFLMKRLELFFRSLRSRRFVSTVTVMRSEFDAGATPD